MGDPRLSGLVVIGAGLPRTGTLSTRAALELLLGGPCYHGSVALVEKEDDQAAWQEAFNSRSIHPVVESGVLDGFKAGLDHPFMCWYQELLALHPTAKVLLTVRDPQRWFASVKGFSFISNSLVNSFPYSSFLSLVGLGKGVNYMRKSAEETFGLSGRFHAAVRGEEPAAVEFFNSHIEEVKSVVPKDQLLIFDVREGWEPLCTFLDLPVPDTPFPNVNDKRQIQVIYNLIRLVTWITLLSLPLLLVCVFYLQLGAEADLARVVVAGALVAGVLYLAGKSIHTLLRNHTRQKTKEL